MTMQQAFSENLKRIMAKEDITVNMLAEWTDSSPNTVTRWRQGRAMPHRGAADELCKIFRVSRAQMFGDDGAIE